MAEFPELSSFGTLLRYAITLEQVLAELFEKAASESSFTDLLGECGKKHRKRATKLERLKRERLNEVVLQAIEGMERESYLPPVDLPADAVAAVGTMADVEASTARFYDDAAARAAKVLTGVEKTFKKLGRESEELGQSLRTKIS